MVRNFNSVGARLNVNASPPRSAHPDSSFNRSVMPDLKIKQYQSESNAWKRSVSHMADENIQMKIRVAEILNDAFDIRLLPAVENFQSRVLNEEQGIILLRHNIAELDKFLLTNTLNYSNVSIEIGPLRTRLQYQITTAEARFNKLKSEFYYFLSENI